MKTRIRMIVGVIAVVAFVVQAPAFFNSEDNTAYGYFTEQTLSKSASQSSTSYSNSFSSTYNYADADGYTGILNRSGSSFVCSGSYKPAVPGHSHWENGKRVCTPIYAWRCSDDKGHSSSYDFEAPYIMGSGNTPRCPKCKAHPPHDYLLNRGDTGKWDCGKVDSDGTPAIDTRRYQQNYSGTVYKTIKNYPKLDRIAVTKQPNKSQYLAYTDFESVGMTVQAAYVDGHAENTNGYTLSGDKNLAAGSTSVRVTFTDNGGTAYADVPITVAKLTGITISRLPDKVEYLEGLVNIDLAGGELTLEYEDSSTRNVPLTEATVTSHGTDIGDIEVTIEYKGFTDTFAAKVKQKSPIRVEVIDPPAKTEYIEELPFESAGMTVKAYYDNLTEAMVDSFTITDGDALALGQNAVTVSYTENGATVTCQQPVTVRAKQLVSIAVDTLPDKQIYRPGTDALDVTGGKLMLTYDNATTKVIDMENSMISGFDNTVLGDQVVTITYEGKTTMMTLKVAKLTGIHVSKLPDTIEYLEELVNIDLTGGELTLEYEDNLTKEIPLTDGSVIDHGTSVGAITVKVAYGGFETSFAAKVKAKSPTRLEILTPPDKTEYIEELPFEFNGLTTKVYYNNNTTGTPTELSSPDGTALQLGQTDVTIAYAENNVTVTCQQPVTVRAKQLVSIAVDTMPEKQEYLVGAEELDVKGGKLLLTYDNGKSKVINMEDSMVSGFDNTILGDLIVTVSYQGKSTSMKLLVYKRSSGNPPQEPQPPVGDIIVKDDELGKDDVELTETDNGGIRVKVNTMHDSMYLVVSVPEGKVARNVLNEEIPSFQDIIDGKLYVKITGDAEFEFIDNPKDYKDMKGHWARSEVERASAREIFAGMEEKQFAPDETMTVAMAAATLHRLDGFKPIPPQVGEKWYDKDLRWAADKLIAREEDLQHPDKPVTRDQLTHMLYRFSVHSKITEENQDAQEWITGNNILIGRLDGKLYLEETATRAEVAMILNKSITTMLMHVK